MKLKLLSLVLCSSLLVVTAFAQSLSPTVISTSGAFFSNSAGMLSTTVGEMTMVESFIKPGGTLTQGFQQPDDFFVSVPHNKNQANIFLQVSPNPGNGMFLLSITSESASKVAVTVFDEAGRLVMQNQFEKTSVSADYRLDLDRFSSGNYFIYCIASSTGNENLQSVYQKIALIK